jgi:hypothetical protein
MRKTAFLFLLLTAFTFSQAQKVDYKNGVIQVDGKDWAKMTVEKRNFGLTKAFEVFNMSGKKIIIAAPATEFEPDKSDNSILFYRVTFLTANQVGIFRVQALGQEKSFAKLLGTSGIMVNDSTSEEKVKEFIARHGATPTIAVDYTVVARDRIWPVRLQEDKNIEQNGKIIGSFTPRGNLNDRDNYEFALPSGVVIAKVSFTGGNNAQNFELFTAKDNSKRVVLIPQEMKVIAASAGIDKNQLTLQRIAKWLVDNQYM